MSRFRFASGTVYRTSLSALTSGVARSGSWERRAAVAVTSPRLQVELEELTSGFESGVGRLRLIAELAELIELFATLSDAQRVGVRLSNTQQRTCPRFHSDAVGLRLLCTWVGEGTEWLREDDVVRERLGHIPPDSLSNTEPLRAGGRIQRMGAFAVGVFKGDGWPGNQGRGAVHRSPQPGGWRVWVSLDAV